MKNHVYIYIHVIFAGQDGTSYLPRSGTRNKVTFKMRKNIQSSKYFKYI